MMTDSKEISYDICPTIRWSWIDDSFKKFIKRVKRKGFCTISSCSGAKRDHPDLPRRRDVGYVDTGYLALLLFDVSRRTRVALDKKFDTERDAFIGRDVPFSELEPIATKNPKKSKAIYERIMQAARKNDFTADFFYGTYTSNYPNGVIGVRLYPNFKGRKPVDDAELVSRWDNFTADL